MYLTTLEKSFYLSEMPFFIFLKSFFYLSVYREHFH